VNSRQLAKKAVKEWYGYQNVDELEMALRVVKRKKPKVIMEIGIAHGASLFAWTKVAKPELSIGLDPLTLEKTPEQRESLERNAKENNIHLIPWVSRLPIAHELLENVLDGRKIDFLFIDGNHGYDDGRHDFQEYKKYLSDDALVGFHDIYYCDVLADAGSTLPFFWERMKRDYNGQYEFHFNSSMGIGMVEMNSYNFSKP
jgi:cephalosporin hydroxylase